MAEEEEPKSLTDIVDDLEGAAGGDGDSSDLSVQDALDEFAGRLFGPLLVIPGLVLMTPLGTIPTLPTTMGVFVILVAGQALFGRKYPWLPGLIAERSVDEQKFEESMEKARPWLEWVDRFTGQRMPYMVKGPMKYVVAAVCVVMGCTMPPLELVPFACVVPGAAIMLLGLAVTAQDGLLALVGLIASVGALGVLVWWGLG
ncbi:exopolysaccharide biosynthesis protein [Botrimarina sp.]|uniref:exopolysaccharide biosynthesis protein n=1 Tax=Botrimarina sp. TaxID=2795802 RepID=UPI0032EDC9B3